MKYSKYTRYIKYKNPQNIKITKITKNTKYDLWNVYLIQNKVLNFCFVLYEILKNICREEYFFIYNYRKKTGGS